jgi:hypothetical protein
VIGGGDATDGNGAVNVSGLFDEIHSARLKVAACNRVHHTIECGLIQNATWELLLSL